MQTLRFERTGDPSVLSLRDLPAPVPGPGEALVEVHAAAINPSDVKIVGGAFSPRLPATPGRDYSGRVVQGDGWEGKEVWGSGAGFGFRRDGAHARYVVVPIDELSAKPKTLSMEQAAGVGAPFVAAWSALVDAGQLREGETLLVTGALGAVGRAATQIAHSIGARVIGADIADGRTEADTWIDLRHQDLVATVRDATEEKGVDIALDAVGGPVFEKVQQSLGLDGRHVAITSVGNRRVEFDLIDFYHKRLRLIGVDTAKLTGPMVARILDRLREGFDIGTLKPPVIRNWPLRQAVDAYRAVAAGDAGAKHVLIPE
ncbi:quinone oxidoreductase family protein [Azospirillum largimobile]